MVNAFSSPPPAPGLVKSKSKTFVLGEEASSSSLIEHNQQLKSTEAFTDTEQLFTIQEAGNTGYLQRKLKS